jgi:hypothetical protein
MISDVAKLETGSYIEFGERDRTVSLMGDVDLLHPLYYVATDINFRSAGLVKDLSGVRFLMHWISGQLSWSNKEGIIEG